MSLVPRRRNDQASVGSRPGNGGKQRELTEAILDYESSRPSPNPMYLTYAQPSFAQPHGLPSTGAYARHTNQQHFATNALFQPQGPFEEPSLSFPTVRSRQIPEVSSFAPRQGSQGTRIFISISAYDEDAVSSLTFYAMFAARRCSGSLTKAGNEGAYGQFTLSVDAPPFASTGWTNRQVPLRLHIQDGPGMDAEVKDVGLFTYIDASQPAPQLSPHDLTRKRKISIESGETSRIPAKRPSTQQLRPGSAELYAAQVYLQQPGAAYMQHPPLEVESSLTNLMPIYNRPQSQGGYQHQESPRRVSHHLSTSSGSSLSQMRVPSPQTPSWSPSTITASHSIKSPNLAAPITRVPSVSSPTSSTTPVLIRTSTLQQSPSPGTTPVGPSASAPFNPYAMYPHKAILKINGDLDLMAEDWTEDEFDVKRRLVQFWRSQSGSTIHTHFKPVTPDERQPNSICISCIWWESKKECYVTSVDTIFLLESLVAVRFTVEEKNRIRRNLEGFRPMTVSKGKPDSEDFFKLIMGFPNPKPRNIEKDVKVFPWKILAHALKKIIGKYVSTMVRSIGRNAILTTLTVSQLLLHRERHAAVCRLVLLWAETALFRHRAFVNHIAQFSLPLDVPLGSGVHATLASRHIILVRRVWDVAGDAPSPGDVSASSIQSNGRIVSCVVVVGSSPTGSVGLLALPRDPAGERPPRIARHLLSAAQQWPSRGIIDCLSDDSHVFRPVRRSRGSRRLRHTRSRPSSIMRPNATALVHRPIMPRTLTSKPSFRRCDDPLPCALHLHRIPFASCPSSSESLLHVLFQRA